MTTSTQEALVQFVAKEILNDHEGLAADDDLLGTGLIDSLGIMRLVAHLDEAYQVSAPPEDVTIENFRTLEAVAAYIESRRNP